MSYGKEPTKEQKIKWALENIHYLEEELKTAKGYRKLKAKQNIKYWQEYIFKELDK